MRRATKSDAPRITAISRQIWNGEDYVPHILDRWMDDPRGELVVALGEGGTVAGFTKLTLLTPVDGWIEGMRVGQALRRRGFGRAMLRHCVEKAASMGLASLRLATHASNEESITLFEASGFQRVASLTYLNAGLDGLDRLCRLGGIDAQAAGGAPDVEVLPAREALARVERSRFLRLAGGFAPVTWTFRKADDWFLADLDGGLLALACRLDPASICLLATRSHEPGAAFLCILEGTGTAMTRLLGAAVGEVRRRSGASRMEYMCPAGHPSYDTARAAGFEPLPGFDAPDVFVYEMRPWPPRTPSPA